MKKTTRVTTGLLCAAVLAGCTSVKLPTTAQLQKNGPNPSNGDACAVDTATALNCARYLRDAFAALESGVGRIEAGYSYLSVALAALTAVYLKSDEDRSQAIEDLAVGVATLAGFRGVYNPAQRLKVATEGREAVECMLQTVAGIDALEAEEANKKTFARVNQSTGIQGLGRALDTHFNVAPLLAKQQRNAGFDAAEVQRFRQALLMQRQVSELVVAQAATETEIKAAADDKVVALRLSFGLQQLLNNARLALVKASLPTENMVIAQRDAVQTMIGDLAKKIEEEQDAALQTQGAVGTTNDVNSANAAAQVAGESESPARRHLQKVYERCGGGDA